MAKEMGRGRKLPALFRVAVIVRRSRMRESICTCLFAWKIEK